MNSFEILLADGVSADNGAVGTKGCAAFDQSSAIFMLARNVAAVIIDVGEYHAGAAKHVILQRYRVVNTDIVLHFDIAADNDIAADKDVLPEGTALADARSAADVHPVSDAGVVANNRAFINDGGFVFEVEHGKLINKAMDDRLWVELCDSFFIRTQSFLFLLSGILVSTLTKPE
jgi:hypothetical protein